MLAIMISRILLFLKIDSFLLIESLVVVVELGVAVAVVGDSNLRSQL